METVVVLVYKGVLNETLDKGYNESCPEFKRYNETLFFEFFWLFDEKRSRMVVAANGHGGLCVALIKGGQRAGERERESPEMGSSAKEVSACEFWERWGREREG